MGDAGNTGAVTGAGTGRGPIGPARDAMLRQGLGAGLPGAARRADNRAPSQGSGDPIQDAGTRLGDMTGGRIRDAGDDLAATLDSLAGSESAYTRGVPQPSGVSPRASLRMTAPTGLGPDDGSEPEA